MKKQRVFLFSISILTLCCNAYSQQDGYKNLKIGDYLFKRNLFTIYEFSQGQSDTMLFYLKSIVPQFICDEPVDYLTVKISKDSLVEFIHLHTKEVIVRDLDDYNKRYKELLYCIVNTVGKADYMDDGTDRQDGRITVAWMFKNGILMALYSSSLALDEKYVKRRFKFAWFKETPPTKMW